MRARGTKEIDFTDDILDARDLRARLAYLADMREDLSDAVDAAKEELAEAEHLYDADAETAGDARDAAQAACDDAEKELSDFDGGTTAEGAEYAILKATEDEIESAAGNGESFIRDTHFTEYCRELCRDLGALPNDLPWYIDGNINWAGVAKDMSADYTDVELDGVTYHYRDC